MEATVLKSEAAIEMSVYIVRAFVHMRDVLNSNKEVLAKFSLLERTLETHDVATQDILRAIRGLMRMPDVRSRPIGFTADLESAK